MKKLIAIAIVALSACGCANLVIRPMCDYNEGPYFCTKTINKAISKAHNGNMIAKTFYPCFIIDWPFDAVTDTLLWPWDKYRYTKRMNSNKRR